MSTTRIIGDIHGKINAYECLLKDQEKTIQVGDFGIGFGNNEWHDRVNNIHQKADHRFIRGNHDNPDKCPSMNGWIRDGHYENGVMFIGGAWSYDHGHRINGVNWWPNEELSMQQFYQIFDDYEKLQPEVMITHDCPFEVATKMFFDTGIAPTGEQISTRTSTAFQSMFEIHQPKFWFFGHWHHSSKLDLKATHFRCLGELDYVDFDFNNMKEK